MYVSGTLSNYNPKALQNKVFFEIMLHFGRRAKEGLRDLKSESFEFRTDDDGHVYVTIAYNEKSKTNHGVESDREEKEQRIMKRVIQIRALLRLFDCICRNSIRNHHTFFSIFQQRKLFSMKNIGTREGVLE